MRFLFAIFAAAITTVGLNAAALACSAAPGPYLNYDPDEAPSCLVVEPATEPDGNHQARMFNDCTVAITLNPVECEPCGGEARLKPGEETVMTLADDADGPEREVLIEWSIEETMRDGAFVLYFGAYGSCEGMTATPMPVASACSTSSGENVSTTVLGLLVLVLVMFRRRQ